MLKTETEKCEKQELFIDLISFQTIYASLLGISKCRKLLIFWRKSFASNTAPPWFLFWQISCLPFFFSVKSINVCKLAHNKDLFFHSIHHSLPTVVRDGLTRKTAVLLEIFQVIFATYRFKNNGHDQDSIKCPNKLRKHLPRFYIFTLIAQYFLRTKRHSAARK